MTKAEKRKAKVQNIPINRIVVGDLNVRIDIGDISELKSDISKRGLLQPITVRPANGDFELVTGRRRYESCKNLGWKAIDAVVRVYENDQEARDDSWAENAHRKNMTEQEKAGYIKDTEEWIQEGHPKWGKRKVRSVLSEHVDLTSKQITVIYDMGELQPKIDSVVIAGPKVELDEEKPKMSISRARKLDETLSDPHVQEKISDLSPEKQRDLRNTLAVEVATRRDHEEILKRFAKSPLRPINDIVAETLRETQLKKGKSATVYFTGEMIISIEKYQKDKGLDKLKNAIMDLLRIGLESEGYKINTVTQEAITEQS